MKIEELATLGYASIMIKLRAWEKEDRGLIYQYLKEEYANKGWLIVDIRAKPYGVVSFFQLKGILRDAYLWLPEWGNPEYKDEKKFKDGYKKLIEAAISRKKRKIILMCAEANVKTCHRRMVANKLSKLLNIPVEHFFQELFNPEPPKDIKTLDKFF